MSGLGAGAFIALALTFALSPRLIDGAIGKVMSSDAEKSVKEVPPARRDEGLSYRRERNGPTAAELDYRSYLNECLGKSLPCSRWRFDEPDAIQNWSAQDAAWLRAHTKEARLLRR